MDKELEKKIRDAEEELCVQNIVRLMYIIGDYEAELRQWEIRREKLHDNNS